MQFRVLGPLEVLDEHDLLALGSGRMRTLLLVLLLHRNEVVSSDRLVDALWGEGAPASAYKQVQGFVSQLRRVLGERRLETVAPGYRLRSLRVGGGSGTSGYAATSDFAGRSTRSTGLVTRSRPSAAK